MLTPGTCSRKFEPHGSLAGHHCQVIERVDQGEITFLLQGQARIEQARAAAWFPADKDTRPRARSAGSIDSSLLNTPRGLNEPVFLEQFRLEMQPHPELIADGRGRHCRRCVNSAAGPGPCALDICEFKQHAKLSASAT